MRGSELLRAVEVMDALRAPDGDAWSALQTHHSLARYLLEETHEVLEAIQALPLDREQVQDGPDGGPVTAALADELGDLLFQILFHARLGEEEDPSWDIDDVARAFVAKMERRNPHVFGDDPEAALDDPDDVEQIVAQWHAVKAAERGTDPSGIGPAQGADGIDPAWFQGIPQALPALQTAAKVVHRARSAGGLEALRTSADGVTAAPDTEQWGGGAARELLDLVIDMESRDEDPETALRTLLARLQGAGPRRGEDQRPASGPLPPGTPPGLA
jgi:uncharacterized protein YabN with tetrapyrrole methylase and pyrophosphatase domain